MARNIRFIPEPDTLVEVTCRTIHGRHLLRPSRALNELFLGVLARAARRFHVRVVAPTVLSTHYHLLLRVDSALQLSQFMTYLNSNLAREIGRLTGWKERIWGRRYTAIIVSREETAQLERLDYVLSQGCKEGLVASPLHWPGIHAAKPLASGSPLQGIWYDRTRQYYARRRGGGQDDEAFGVEERLDLVPLPCWDQLPRRQRLERARAMIRTIENRTRVALEAEGRRPLGPDAIRRQDPLSPSQPPPKRPTPYVHAASRKVRESFVEGFRLVIRSYREASLRLRQGEHEVTFPEGTFPPALPFAGRASPASS